MARIFISYSRKDETFALQLAKSLSDLDADIWIDVDDIPAGMNWSSAIQQGLDLCEVMIVIITPDSAASHNVEEEWQYYRDNGKPVIPILLKAAKVHFQLSRIQYVDFNKQDFDTALRQLHTELRRKGVALNPVSASEKSVPIPPQKALPVRSKSQRKRWFFGAGAAGVGVVLLIAVLSMLSNGNQPPALTPTTEVAQAPTSTETPPNTDTPIPILTPTEIPVSTSVPSNTSSETATSTSVVTPTNTATATFEPSETQTLSATPGPLGFPGNPVARNDNWIPLTQEFDGVQMALVPVGCFDMGENGEGGRQCFEEPFWIDVYEVTNAQYGSSGYFSGANRPRERVTWFDARDFCTTRGTRLPTEAEWEYAARGPDILIYPWGNEFVADYVEYSDNTLDGPAEVGSRENGVSWVGTLDMSGNVWEWTSTVYRDYPYDANDGRESNNDPNNLRVLRGGSWYVSYNSVRVTYRLRNVPSILNFDYGFRCTRDFAPSDLEGTG